ncbi:MAG: septum formation initiator family protein [Bacteroidota bacterium]|nr:septum formation initiator family protein [Bacteroidota bacterium]
MRIPKILRNKYFYTGLAFFIWLSFFDANNLIYQFTLSSKLDKSREQKEFYQEEIAKDSTALRELMTNMETLEKFARERYLMKKDEEDIYLVVRRED